MNKKFIEMITEDRFKPFNGKIVALFNVITIGGGSRSTNVYHVENPDGTKWNITTEDDLKIGKTVKVTKKMNPKKYSDGKFPKAKQTSYRG